MSALTLREAVQAPLQKDDQTIFSPVARAFVTAGEFFYYRRAQHYRDWIEAFTHKGESLGSFRSLSHFQNELGSESQRRPLIKTDAGRALYRALQSLIGHRIVGIEIMEASDCLMPFSVLHIDDGREVIIQSDPEGNDGGFPNVVRPSGKEEPG